MDPLNMLAAFGLTHQEAKLYTALHGHGAATGYELARLAGISRSNAYASLSSLEAKGAANIIDGKPQRYQAVPIAEFCANHIRTLGEMRDVLERELVLVDEDESPYLTIKGGANIVNKIKTIIEATRKRIYLAMPAHLLRRFVPPLEELTGGGGKVVVVTDAGLRVAGAMVHHARQLSGSVRVIADSSMTLAGELDGSDSCTCLYSMKKNLVNLIRDSIRNEIRLIELTHDKGKEPS